MISGITGFFTTSEGAGFLALLLLVLLAGCAPTQELREEWARNVASGEYGWINFNTGEVRNLDPYPQSRIDHILGNFNAEYSQRCLEQIRSYSGDMVIEIHFLLTKKGNPGNFIIMSDRASSCAHNIIDALRNASFRPGLREGQPVTSVGEYRHPLSARGGYENW